MRVGDVETVRLLVMAGGPSDQASRAGAFRSVRCGFERFRAAELRPELL
jgi:hypothetical protein